MSSTILFVAVCAFAGLGIGLAPVKWSGRAGVLLALLPLVLVIGRIAIDMGIHKGSHNLFPIEIGALFLTITLPMLVGLCIGLIIRDVTVIPKFVYLVIVSVAIVLAIYSPFLLFVQSESDDKKALTMLRELWKEEQAYAAANPDHLYTCEGPELPGFKDQRWFSGDSAHQSQMYISHFGFKLCASGGSLGKWFSIEASSKDGYYCVSEPGEIKFSAYGKVSLCGH